MCSRHAPTDGADAVTHYRVPLRALDSDHTTYRDIAVYGPRDLTRQLDLLQEEFADYRLGTPRELVA